MRIKQFYSNFGNHFADAMAKKYDLTLNLDSVKMDEPLFMFGCYNLEQVWRAIRHQSGGQITVICWAGSDAKNLQFKDEAGNYVFAGLFNRFPRIKHIAISKWIAADLGMMALPFYRIPITPYDYSDIKPEPLGDSIYMYKPDDPTYNGGIYHKIKEALPDYNFIESTFHDHTRAEIIEIYKKCFIGLRFTEHDGLSNTVCEMGMMGRMMINNGDVPNCIWYKSDYIEHITNVIKDANNFETDPDEVSHKVSDYLNIGTDFLETTYYE
jgi:hypothetical protein